MNNLDVLFIHPGNHRETYQDLASEYTAIAPPAWTCLLAGSLRKYGKNVAIHDCNIDGWNKEICNNLITKYVPKLIVMMVYGHQPSASTQTMPIARTIIQTIRQEFPSIMIALGGTHPSALPHETCLHEDVQFVIQGEGLNTILDLLNDKQIDQIPGLWSWKYSQFGNPLKLIENINTDLNDYAWDLLPPLNKYRAHNMHCFQDFKNSVLPDFSDIRSPYVAMNTSLGCPYNCNYCCIHSVFGKPCIRYWDLEIVMGWIDNLVARHHIRNIRFDDELFILSPKRIERFCDMLIERNYGLNILVYGRVDTTKEQLLKKLKKAGVNWVCLGIESGNQSVRNSANKIIKCDIVDTIKTIQKNDIYVLGNYMFGLPDDNMQTMKDTLNLAKELNCEYSNFYTVMTYPGSELYRQNTIKKNGLYPQDDWNTYSQHGYLCKPSPTKYLSSRDVLMFRDEAFVDYHSSEKYLNMINEKFGPKVKQHIEKMLKINIKRKILEDYYE